MTLIHTPNYGRSTGLRVTVSSKAATALISTADMKAFARVDASYTGDDTLIDTLVDEVTELAQEYTQRSFINRTLIAEWDSVRGDGIILPYGQVQSITTVETIDTTGAATALTSDDYEFINGKIYIHTHYGLRVTYVSGYGATVADVPAAIKLAVKKAVLDQYDNRENQVVGDNVDTLSSDTFFILNRYINYE